MYWLYSVLLAFALLASLPYWLFEALRHGKYRDGLGERLGRLPQRLAFDSSRRSIWIHAVSVGEVLLVSNLVVGLKELFPEHNVFVSTTTATGQKLAREKFGSENVFYFPLDFAFAIRPYLRGIRPQLIVLAETEFWPNFLRLAHDSGAKVAVVNARISDQSLPGYKRFDGIFRKILKNVDLFLTQTEEDSRRVLEIGALANRIEMAGNLKFDIVPSSLPGIVEKLRRMFAETHAGPILVGGSTMDGEETLLLQAFENILASHPKAVMILAPRHPQRFEAVADLLGRLDFRFWLRSHWNGEALSGGVLLVDSIGELAGLYSIADIAFVGGSLVPFGGHNIIEPAWYGIPIVVGNHTANFRDMVGLFQSKEAIRIAGPAELPLVFMELLANEADRRALGRRAAETLKSQTGATQKTLEALQKLISGVQAA